jgi:uncharacterized protein YbbC (DUF1343 family)
MVASAALHSAAVPRVQSGLEVLVHHRLGLLRGQRFGVLAHQSSVDGRLDHAVSLLRDVRGARLVALFAPEHGLWGAAQDLIPIAAERDPLTGLRVVSLYGERREPTPAMLRGLDLLVIDLQDIGSRYYTYQWTTALAVRACARLGVRVLVLDRPNPLGGELVEGNVPDPAFASFVGLYPLAARPGLTMGEVVRHLQQAQGLGGAVDVVAMRGWRRDMVWEDTGLPWVAPSPNMPTPDTARVYPGGCLIEGTNMSEGRGTTRPFEWVGAPWLDAHDYAEALAADRLPGVAFRPARFRPTFQKWAEQVCGGVHIHVTDPARFKPFLTGLAVIAVARRLGRSAFRWRKPPYEFEFRKLPIDILLGTDRIRHALERGQSLTSIEQSWQRDLAKWRRRRSAALLYD